jgi:foldase protein PrsA
VRRPEEFVKDPPPTKPATRRLATIVRSMSRVRRYVTALGAFFVLAVGIAACGSGLPGNSVADVAGNPVTSRAFDHWMYVAAKSNSAQSPGAPVIVPNDPPQFTGCIKQARKAIPTLRKTPTKALRSDCQQLFTSLNSQVMNFLITGYWYQLEARRLHINVTAKQVQATFEKERKQAYPTQAAYQAFLKETGQTTADILYRVRIDLILSKLEARHTQKVTSATIAAYYNSHQSEFGTAETRNLRLVRTNTKAQADAALAALRSGQSWCKVTKRYSVDAATKNSCGTLTGVTSGQEEKALNNAAFSAPANKVEGPVHGLFGYYVFEVTKVTPGSRESLAKATPTIRQLLQSQNATNSQTAVNNAARKDWRPKTQCRADWAISDCANYKAPKSTALPSTGAPSGATTVPATTTPSKSKSPSKSKKK